jgi:Arc/MetJ family transcription regulator
MSLRPLPDLTDDAAMAKLGRMSAIGSARNAAANALRDANTAVQTADWGDLAAAADAAIQAAERIKTVAAMWSERYGKD